MTFPTILARTGCNDTGVAAATYTPLTGFAANAGAFGLFVCSSNSSGITLSTSSTGWTLQAQYDRGGLAPTIGIFTKDSLDASENLTINLSSGSARFSGILVEVSGGDGVLSASANGASGGPNPPNCNPAVSRDHLWIALTGGGTTPTVAPTNYGNLTTHTSTGVARMAIADRQLAASAEDPGLFTAASSTWVAATVALWNTTVDYTITADPGTYALTGTAATLRIALRLTADAGTYILTGTAAALKRGYTIVAAPGSYTLTGTAVTFRQALRMAAASGSYLLTGTAAGFISGKSISLDPGFYEITWGEPTITASIREYISSGTERVFTVSAETRLVAVSGLPRLTFAAAQNRTITLPPERRQI